LLRQTFVHCGRFPTVASRSVPEGLEEGESPTYEVDSIAIIEDDHRRCEGCRSNYSSCIRHYGIYCFVNSNNWGKQVENHKWVIHDEIKEAGDDPFQTGSEVVIEAGHMEGMKGANAQIDSGKDDCVYG